MKNIFLPSTFFDYNNFPFSDIFVDIYYTWDILRNIETYIKNYFIKNNLNSNYKGINNVLIGKGTVIQEDVIINGSLITGENCVIGHGSLIRENCVFGDNVHIGHAVEVKNSVILNNSRIAHLNYIGDSIIGNNVNISGGAISANYRLDKKPVYIRYNDRKIETNLQKFGSIIGDKCNIGVNAVLNPGTILEKNCIVYPLKSVTGFHKENSIIK